MINNLWMKLISEVWAENENYILFHLVRERTCASGFIESWTRFRFWGAGGSEAACGNGKDSFLGATKPQGAGAPLKVMYSEPTATLWRL